MRCYEMCPKNNPVRKSVYEKGEFDEEETSLLAAGTPLDSLPKVTVDKIESLQLHSYELICRNLAALKELWNEQ